VGLKAWFDRGGPTLAKVRAPAQEAWIYRFALAPAEGQPGEALRPRPVFCGSQGSSRRSGRFPALPYPPLEQRECFPFPFPWGALERETGNGSLS
jgi:hypothetical protein